MMRYKFNIKALKKDVLGQMMDKDMTMSLDDGLRWLDKWLQDNGELYDTESEIALYPEVPAKEICDYYDYMTEEMDRETKSYEWAYTILDYDNMVSAEDSDSQAVGSVEDLVAELPEATEGQKVTETNENSRKDMDAFDGIAKLLESGKIADGTSIKIDSKGNVQIRIGGAK